mgnify:FL=1
MSVRVKVDVDVKRIPPKIQNATGKAQYVLANQVHADMNPYVPMLTGDLRNQSTIAIDGKSIYYNVPYARYQFYIQHSRYTTPGTGPRWDLKAKAIHGRSWARVAGRAMRL